MESGWRDQIQEAVEWAEGALQLREVGAEEVLAYIAGRWKELTPGEALAVVEAGRVGAARMIENRNRRAVAAARR